MNEESNETVKSGKVVVKRKVKAVARLTDDAVDASGLSLKNDLSGALGSEVPGTTNIEDLFKPGAANGSSGGESIPSAEASPVRKRRGRPPKAEKSAVEPSLSGKAGADVFSAGSAAEGALDPGQDIKPKRKYTRRKKDDGSLFANSPDVEGSQALSSSRGDIADIGERKDTDTGSNDSQSSGREDFEDANRQPQGVPGRDSGFKTQTPESRGQQSDSRPNPADSVKTTQKGEPRRLHRGDDGQGFQKSRAKDRQRSGQNAYEGQDAVRYSQNITDRRYSRNGGYGNASYADGGYAGAPGAGYKTPYSGYGSNSQGGSAYRGEYRGEGYGSASAYQGAGGSASGSYGQSGPNYGNGSQDSYGNNGYSSGNYGSYGNNGYGSGFYGNNAGGNRYGNGGSYNVNSQIPTYDSQQFGGPRQTFDNRDKRKGQKKYITMEDISIPVELYEEHLAKRMLVRELAELPLHNLKLKLCEMTGASYDDYVEYKHQEIMNEIVRLHISAGGVVYTKGVLEVLPDGFGFLRSPASSYMSGPEDVYLASGIIKYLNLKTGDTVEGTLKNPSESDKFFAISKIAFVNGDEPIVAKTRVSFDNLVPLYPDKRINLETPRTDGDVSMRIVNLFCPIGKGQRALITAPPRTGKTILLQQIANAITANHPEIELIVLLVDERPEEVTDMKRHVKGEVISSTFDEQATRHVAVAEMVIEKAKRLVEHKKDVVILLDSITRLARAYNQTVPASGKILSGGVDSNALHKPKRFFGAARNIENGGSLTIIASALIETGSRMDEVIFEEFKGTGNSEIVLDRMMAERRLFPAINIKKSGTRREDLLLSEEEASKIWILRNTVLNRMEDFDITSLLVDKMKKTSNNEAFLRSMNTGSIPVN